MDRLKDYNMGMCGLSMRKSHHSIEDLEEVIKFNKETFDNAAKSNFLSPYITIAHAIHTTLMGVRDVMHECLKDSRKKHVEKPNERFYGLAKLELGLSGNTFRFEVYENELTRMIDMLNSKIPVIEEKVVYFDSMKDCLLKHIQLEVLPNELFDGERIYLSKGHVIIPSGLNPTGYHVFGISAKAGKDGSSLDFDNLVNSHPVSSVEEAIKKYVDPDVIASVAVAKNTEFYPLMETALPIVREKYEKGLLEQA
ncbi:MAG: hypothetical protein V1645_02580 [archaeon]